MISWCLQKMSYLLTKQDTIPEGWLLEVFFINTILNEGLFGMRIYKKRKLRDYFFENNAGCLSSGLISRLQMIRIAIYNVSKVWRPDNLYFFDLNHIRIQIYSNLHFACGVGHIVVPIAFSYLVAFLFHMQIWNFSVRTRKRF